MATTRTQGDRLGYDDVVLLRGDEDTEYLVRGEEDTDYLVYGPLTVRTPRDPI